MTTTPHTPLVVHPRAAEHAAWVFYATAALGSTIGQVWVGLSAPPWPPQLAWWWRVLLVTPFAVVIDLGGVVCAAFADTRQRLGEAAYGWRILSGGSVATGVGINIVGHATTPYLAVVFGGLGIFAYTVWLLHTAARRRDALRAQGKLADTPPAYGPTQWWREPTLTRRARTLARAGGYDPHESLHLAREQLRAEQRHTALARHVDTLIRSRHDNPVLAAIAATTVDLDAIAAQLTAHSDVTGWARLIGANLRPPPPPATNPVATAGDPLTATEPTPPATPAPPIPAPPPRIPTRPDTHDRWRAVWLDMLDHPDLTTRQVAARHHISPRQAQRVRRVGAAGHLNAPNPTTTRQPHPATSGPHSPAERA
ncbi:MAG: hypothetical protein HYR62_02880 [Actinobacteria bacterium]|nr:hypothetical protein [Actinomycetota bacterium]MBI3687414.1 hypothetical protein [Actinomycetota bacterium]